MTKFDIGEEITLTTRDGAKATVEYGPFDDRDVYVVKLVDEPGDDNPRTFTALSSVMRKLPAFAIGDTVTSLSAFSGAPAEIVAGPFTSRIMDRVFWIVEREGRHSAPREFALTKVATPASIKVGDRVRVTDDDGGGGNRFNGRIGTVKELNGGGSSLPYLVEFGDGSGYHGDRNGTWNCAAVERIDEDADTFTHDGVTYDLSATYRDRDGDVWRLKRVNGAVRARMASDGDAAPNEDSHVLARVAAHWGPLARV